MDDEEGVRKLCCAVLQANGYNVLEADNGEAALAAYEKNAHKVDMLLTDVVMRQMNGFELGRTLGQRTPGLKILYMSGYRDNAGGAEAGKAPRCVPSQAVHARCPAGESPRSAGCRNGLKAPPRHCHKST